MHFHRALVERFRQQYGANFLKLLKPSSQREAWIGFDQGWVRTSLTTSELFSELKTAIQNQPVKTSSFFFGYFLQFKVVERLVRGSKHKPATYNTPYFRAELSLDPNRTTGISQHETLLRLNSIAGTSVSYACAMIFNTEDIWEEPNLDKLRLVNISASPPGWATKQQHFLTFQTETDPHPLWCSDPVEGQSFSFDEWAFENNKLSPKKMTGNELHKLILASLEKITEKRIMSIEDGYLKQGEDPVTQLLPPCFTILEFTS